MRERLVEAPPLVPEQARRGRQEGHGDHPLDRYLKEGRIPHIWCSGCGNGIVVTALVKALQKADLDPQTTAVVSGIGCSGRAAGYLALDTYHTTHGRAVPFATGLKLANPKLNVVVVSGDGDLFAIGGNHLIHAARRNVDLTVVCVNNFNYGMTGGQGGPTTPIDAISTTTPYGCNEHPFNLTTLARAAGAAYAARWTVLHTYELRDSIAEAMKKRGFCFIEVISPCPTAHGRRNKLGSALDLMRHYRDNAYLADELDPDEAPIGLSGKFAVGKFADVEKPTFLDLYEQCVVARSRSGEKRKREGSAAGAPEKRGR